MHSGVPEADPAPAVVGGQPAVAVEHVLQQVVGGVTDIGLGVDYQPRFPLRGENVVTVQVGGKQHLAVRGVRQFPEQRDPGPGQAWVDAVGGSGGIVLLLEFLRPRRAHLRERAERAARMRCRPEPAQQPGNDRVLLGLGQHLAQRSAGQAPLDQQPVRRAGR